MPVFRNFVGEVGIYYSSPGFGGSRCPCLAGVVIENLLFESAISPFRFPKCFCLLEGARVAEDVSRVLDIRVDCARAWHIIDDACIDFRMQCRGLRKHGERTRVAVAAEAISKWWMKRIRDRWKLSKSTEMQVRSPQKIKNAFYPLARPPCMGNFACIDWLTEWRQTISKKNPHENVYTTTHPPWFLARR